MARFVSTNCTIGEAKVLRLPDIMNTCKGFLTDRLELWGGVECTLNRVGHTYFSQLAMSGHDRRPADIDRIAALGIRTLRYPILWEMHALENLDNVDWSWADDRLKRIQENAIRPIIGFVHHGSGPQYTNLLDPGFATGLARFASGVARRYPWLDAFTPVNEPLTTARFSALYGHWYPHRNDPRAFAEALLHQCRAIVLSMNAIREVRSDAQLVQTEDLGYTHSSPELDYQATFENERRWLTFDLLSGRVDRHHPLGHYFLWLGVNESRLHWFQDHACPPDILGINHYLTSERYLDSRTDLYPTECLGGNGRQQYADVEAVRVARSARLGPGELLLQVWQRYHRPVAVTEVHLGCTREEQLRWLWEVWCAAEAARRKGADVRAVTIWSLFGCFDWDSLVTRARGNYEPGAFDVRSSEPRATALASLAASLARGSVPAIPVLAHPGWWQRDARIVYNSGALGPLNAEVKQAPQCQLSVTRPILITGATGTLGHAFARICQSRGLDYCLLRRSEMEITSRQEIMQAIEHWQPWAVINAAGYVRVDDAERDRSACYRDNVRGARLLASICAELQLPFVTFSSDLVFDGNQSSPYRESDAVGPVCFYGRAKAVAERHVLRLHPQALVIRTSAFFGPWDRHNFVTLALRVLGEGRSFAAADDAIVSPTYVPDLAHCCLDLLLDGAGGVWHLANQGETSWAELARDVATRAGISKDGITSCSCDALGWLARRPRYSVLGTERGVVLPTLSDALDRYLAARTPEESNELMTTSLA